MWWKSLFTRERRRSSGRSQRPLAGLEWLEARAMLAALTLEAESGTLSGVTRAASVSGYSGTGYVTGFDTDTDRVAWAGFTAEPGSYRMTIRYRSPFGEKGFEGSLNGVAFSGMLPQS